VQGVSSGSLYAITSLNIHDANLINKEFDQMNFHPKCGSLITLKKVKPSDQKLPRFSHTTNKETRQGKNQIKKIFTAVI
jgi:hypothetical protein